MVRYLLGPDGVTERTEIAQGDSGELWPVDVQMALADMDRDGHSEVWFATTSGRLWRYDPARDPSPTHVCTIQAGLGPIAPGFLGEGGRPLLYLGSRKAVLRLEATP